MLKKLVSGLFAKPLQFIKFDIWRIPSTELSSRKLFCLKQLKIALLVLRGFAKDKCLLRASALTYYSLLSVVPVAALAFGIAKNFGFEKKLEKQIFDNLPGQHDVAQQIVHFSKSLIESVEGGLIAGIGTALLFWTVVKLLVNIEHSFKIIWGVKNSRTLVRKVRNYFLIMLICPVLMIMASSITVVVKSELTLLVEKLFLSNPFSGFIIFSFKFLPFLVVWTVFTFLYIYMPNKKVRFRAGLLGGIVAGTVFQFVQWTYIVFQAGASSYGAIYGSFAALPLFLFWLQISWLILLFGAELSCAQQNVQAYELEKRYSDITPAFRRLLALGISHLCVKTFFASERPRTAEEISHYFEIPIMLTRQTLDTLTKVEILSAMRKEESDSCAYEPLREPETLTIEKVIEALDNEGSGKLSISNDEGINVISNHLKEMKVLIEKSSSNVALKNI